MSAFDPGALHLVNGDSAGFTFVQVFGCKDRLLIHRDVLSCGPIPQTTNLADWCELRRGFWRDLLEGQLETHSPQASADLWDSAARLQEADELVVWAATGNTDQLTIAFVVQLMQRLDADPAKLQLVQFESEPGTGALDPGQWQSHPSPRALTNAGVADYRAAWTALTSNDPHAIETFLAARPGATAHLAAAMRLVLLRYPDPVSGLDAGDLKLLGNARRFGPSVARVIGQTMAQKFESGDLEGDLYLFSRIIRMADLELPRALLKLGGSATAMRETTVELTPFGIEVLEGRQSWHSANPIDDWAGGVHLSSADGNLWFNDNGRIVRG